jgi:uncharacterized phage protein gp47/JayE
MMQLSNIAPDWDSLVSQLQTQAATYPTWTDRITGATGQTIIEMIAAIGAYSQFAIESSYQEAFPDSAKNADSLYAATNYAGVRVARKSPASITFNMTSTSSRTIDPYTQFVGAGTNWFNRDALTFVANTPRSVTLYQGSVVTKSAYGQGTDFQAFVSAEDSFQVSNTDVLLLINNVSVPVIIKGLWTKKGQAGVQDFTLPDGRMIVLFGNDIYGSKPGANDVVQLTYVVTAGQDGTNIVTQNKQIVMDGDPTVSGTPSGGPSGGGNEPDYVIFKNVTPALFGAFDSAVTGTQYKALPLQYPGVIDARVLSQREINPYALNWMNTMKVSLLTESSWSPTDWSNFETWFNDSTMYSTRIVRSDPQPVNITVTAIVSCKTFSNLTNVQAEIEAALQNLFALRQGSIGLDIYMSDIITTIKEADSNVEFVQLISPTIDYALSTLGVEAPTLTEVLGGGTLPIGTYDYSINVSSTLGGSSAPAKWASITTTANNSAILLNWPSVPNAANYGVWGRITGPALGLVASPGNVLTYTDTGAVTPTPPVPVESTISAYYPNLTAINLTMQYTNRNIRS